jgi:hypothetical protein
VWPLSTPAENQLRRSHSIAVRATAYGPRGALDNLPVVDGAVTVDSGSQVRRTATVTIGSPALWPADPLDVLSPYGAEVQLDYGIVIPRVGIEWIPLIRGVVTDVQRTRPTGNAPVELRLADRSIRVAEDRLDAPAQTVSGATVVAEITRLIQQTIPAATVVDRTGSTQVAPVMEIERERWADGTEKLADSIGAEVFCDPQGTFVIRPQPTLADTVVWDITSGQGGILVAKTDTRSRDRVYNRVVAIGERTDGTPPVRAGVSDTDPDSPTYYGGPFGRKTYFYSSPLLTTVGQCTTAATSILARARGAGATVTVEAIVNPALDAGDVIRVHDEGITQTHIIDRVEIPLRPNRAQPISTRSLDLEAT